VVLRVKTVTTTILLARHGDNDSVGHTLVGWTPGIHLNQRGRDQADRLAARLSDAPIQAVYSSPLERAVETAEPIARSHGLAVGLIEAVGEIRLGQWTNRAIRDLRDDPDWRRFNAQRSTTRIPGGETMLEVQTRMVDAFEALRRKHPDQTIVVVSHGDPIRGILMHYLGMPLDFIHRLEIGTASLSTILLHDWGPQVLSINAA
jgi:probable phosphomutase (TIGR03848 family)